MSSFYNFSRAWYDGSSIRYLILRIRVENTGYGFTARMLKLRCDGTVLLCVAMPRCHPVMQLLVLHCIAMQCPHTSSVLGSNTRSEHSQHYLSLARWAGRAGRWSPSTRCSMPSTEWGRRHTSSTSRAKREYTGITFGLQAFIDTFQDWLETWAHFNTTKCPGLWNRKSKG